MCIWKSWQRHSGTVARIHGARNQQQTVVLVVVSRSVTAAGFTMMQGESSAMCAFTFSGVHGLGNGKANGRSTIRLDVKHSRSVISSGCSHSIRRVVQLQGLPACVLLVTFYSYAITYSRTQTTDPAALCYRGARRPDGQL